MKPYVIFTNFWDANVMVQDGYMTYCSINEQTSEKKFYMVWLRNYQVYSIALGIPESSKIPFLKNIFRLNHFCPTYNLLMSYKKDGDWGKYREAYRKLLISRKEDINDWLSTLEEDKIYILCCWEDTSKRCNCHRKILFDALRSTRIWKDKAIWIYRHGNGKYFRMYPSKTINAKSQNKHSINMACDDINGVVLGNVGEFKLLTIDVVASPLNGMEMSTLTNSSYTSEPSKKE